MNAPITVRAITAEEHLAWLRTQPSASFLQTPAWGEVKRDWRHESVGWFEGGQMVGAALVLHRSLPRIKRSLAYVPEGPCIDWGSPRLVELLRALRDHLKAKGAFALRLGPARRDAPLGRGRRSRTPSPSDTVLRYDDARPTTTDTVGLSVVDTLERLGFRHLSADDGFTAGQPEYVFQVPLAGRTEADLLAGMNQLWRRNIKKTERNGVQVRVGDASDIAAFHRVYVETAERDRFTPARTRVLRAHVCRDGGRGPRADPRLPRRARGRRARRDDLDPRRRARVVLLRSLDRGQARAAGRRQPSSGG